MKEKKDGNWTDWLIDDKHRLDEEHPYEEPKSERRKFQIKLIASVATLFVMICLMFPGYECYERTMFPFGDRLLGLGLFLFTGSAIVYVCVNKLMSEAKRENTGCLIKVCTPFILWFCFLFFFLLNSNLGKKITRKELASVTEIDNPITSPLAFGYVLTPISSSNCAKYWDVEWKKDETKSYCLVTIYEGFFGLEVLDEVLQKNIRK